MSPKDKKILKGKQGSEDALFIDREQSWLAFNLRVLMEAADGSVPLLERLKFLNIYQSNLEEFFRVRIGLLTHSALLTPDERDPLTGLSPAQQIQEALRTVREQQPLLESVWNSIREDLRFRNIEVLDFDRISKIDELMCKKIFGDLKNSLFPRVVDESQPLPFLWNDVSYVVAALGGGSDPRVAVLPLDRVPQYLSFEIDGSLKVVLTAQLVEHFFHLLVKRETVYQTAVIKVTRNADVFLSNLEAGKNEDLRRRTEGMLTRRKREVPVRVQIYGRLSDSAMASLIKKLRVPEESVFSAAVPFDLSFSSCIGNQEGLRYEERRPSRDIGLKKGEYFKYIEKHDLLMSFPFQSMLPFVDLIYEAADDPEVLSIKVSLYRMSASSKVAAALAYAADKGKNVLCLLELRARFDEQNNIDYSELLEDAGCKVIYGLPYKKVHSKLFVITRQHQGNISYITQVGTGNYNEVTGEQYTDLSLITADEVVGREAEEAFAALAEGKVPPETHSLWIAPLSYKSRVLEMLDREIEKGRRGRVVIKVNSMNSLEIMEKLIECSRAGVRVELYIRGICCLRPGIPGWTDNISVKSVVGRWLEHSRIFSFGEGEDERLFIGSGDLLNRNLERRVEAFIEVKSSETREQVRHILDALRNDREKSRIMQPDGSYLREEGGAGTSSQEALYWYFSKMKVKLDYDPEEKAEEKPGLFRRIADWFKKLIG